MRNLTNFPLLPELYALQYILILNLSSSNLACRDDRYNCKLSLNRPKKNSIISIIAAMKTIDKFSKGVDYNLNNYHLKRMVA